MWPGSDYTDIVGLTEAAQAAMYGACKQVGERMSRVYARLAEAAEIGSLIAAGGDRLEPGASG